MVVLNYWFLYILLLLFLSVMMYILLLLFLPQMAINTMKRLVQHEQENQQQPRRQGIRIILPCGYRFCPVDSELLLHYLRNKILGRPLSRKVIEEVDIYNYSIEQLKKIVGEFRQAKGKESYFFVVNDPKYPNGERPNRITSDGYWKATSGDVSILHRSQIIGYKKNLVLYLGKGRTAKKTNWIMHEYRFNQQTLSVDERRAISSQMKNCVLCRIRNHKDYRKVTIQEKCNWNFFKVEGDLKRQREEECCTDNTTDKDYRKETIQEKCNWNFLKVEDDLKRQREEECCTDNTTDKDYRKETIQENFTWNFFEVEDDLKRHREEECCTDKTTEMDRETKKARVRGTQDESYSSLSLKTDVKWQQRDHHQYASGFEKKDCGTKKIIGRQERKLITPNEHVEVEWVQWEEVASSSTEKPEEHYCNEIQTCEEEHGEGMGESLGAEEDGEGMGESVWAEGSIDLNATPLSFYHPS